MTMIEYLIKFHQKWKVNLITSVSLVIMKTIIRLFKVTLGQCQVGHNCIDQVEVELEPGAGWGPATALA